MKILAYIEQRGGELKKNAFETVTAARNLAGEAGGTFAALLVGDNLAGLADRLAPYGATDVILVEEPRLASYASGAVATGDFAHRISNGLGRHEYLTLSETQPE